MTYALCIEHLDTTIVQLGNIASGSFGGPMLAVFTMGLFLPWCNTKVRSRFGIKTSLLDSVAFT